MNIKDLEHNIKVMRKGINLNNENQEYHINTLLRYIEGLRLKKRLKEIYLCTLNN